MTEKKLTVGMATYDDFDGVYFSIQSIELYHPKVSKDIEYLVIDNNPDGKHSKAILDFLKSEVPNKHRYIPFGKKISSFTKYKVFELAKTPLILCMDSHVFLEKGSLNRLLNYYKNHPKTKNLLQGPLVRGGSISTDMRPEWSGGMWGTWNTDKRGIYKNQKPFEIKMQGMGLLSCRKEAWPHISQLFSGFGAEEGYIQGKFKQKGAKTLCLPFLRWYHRFYRPEGVAFTLTWEDRVRNYFIGFVELGWDVKPVMDHFKWIDKKKMGKILNEVKNKMKQK